MSRSVLSLIVLLAASLAAGAAFAQRRPAPPEPAFLLHAGRLIATPGQPAAARRTLVVHGGRIVSVHDGFRGPGELDLPEGAEPRIVNLAEHTVLPGLMEAHAHLSRATGAFAPRFGGRGGPRDPAVATVNTLIAARLSLAAGFTTLRDVGSDDHSVFAVRDAIRRGHLLGPRILASGPSISVTGGHGDDTATLDPDARARAGICDGADECRRLVRHLKKRGADLIKMKATGGFSSQTGLGRHMLDEEMRAIIDTAHLLGMKVAMHAYDAGAINAALRLGVDSVEHGYLLDDEGITLMKSGGAYLSPTIIIARPPAIARMVAGEAANESVRLRAEHAAFERALAAGVNIVLGTDSGIYPHGRSVDELVRMTELGMSNDAALVAATTAPAALFGIADETGRLAPGLAADVIAVRGDPRADIRALAEVDFVMAAGRIAKLRGEVVPALRYDLEHRY